MEWLLPVLGGGQGYDNVQPYCNAAIGLYCRNLPCVPWFLDTFGSIFFFITWASIVLILILFDMPWSTWQQQKKWYLSLWVVSHSLILCVHAGDFWSTSWQGSWIHLLLLGCHFSGNFCSTLACHWLNLWFFIFISKSRHQYDVQVTSLTLILPWFQFHCHIRYHHC